ncbi:MAG: hypothetical protein AAF456_19425 [Planctomycetota bacterium]
MPVYQSAPAPPQTGQNYLPPINTPASGSQTGKYAPPRVPSRKKPSSSKADREQALLDRYANSGKMTLDERLLLVTKKPLKRTGFPIQSNM